MRVLGRKQTGTTFYCFTPLIMAATFLIEASLLVYVAMRYKLNASGRIIVGLLACLATFQLAEYMVCEGAVGTANFWARIGFVAITLLPPLGLYLVHTIKPSRESKLTLSISFAAAGLLCTYFALAPNTLAETCTGNYVIFRIPEPYNVLNGIYYYTVTVFSFVLAWRGRAGLSASKNRALKWYGIGLMSFLLPTAIIAVINLNAMQGIPSIMCGFALTLAIILAFKVAPKVSNSKD